MSGIAINPPRLVVYNVYKGLLVNITNHLRIDEMMCHLLSRQLISHKDKEHMLCILMNMGVIMTAEHFITQIMMKKNDHGSFNQFIEILRQTNHKDMADQLEAEFEMVSRKQDEKQDAYAAGQVIRYERELQQDHHRQKSEERDEVKKMKSEVELLRNELSKLKQESERTRKSNIQIREKEKQEREQMRMDICQERYRLERIRQEDRREWEHIRNEERQIREEDREEAKKQRDRQERIIAELKEDMMQASKNQQTADERYYALLDKGLPE